MKSIKSTGSVFSFEAKDTSIKECRPLVDPLPPFTEVQQVSSQASSVKWSQTGSMETPTSEFSFGFQKSGGGLEPAGSPSFARRPIANGHYQRGNFTPSIRIHQPPGGFGQIGM